MNNQQLWQAVLGELELILSKANFTTWFKGTFIAENNDDKIVVGVPNAFTKNWLEKKYHSYIIKSLQNITEKRIRNIEYKVNPKIAESPEKEEETKKEKVVDEKKAEKIIEKTEEDGEKDYYAPESIKNKTDQINKGGINKKYSFENFIVGKGNELAHAAAQAVAKKPGESYNPLFLYGGVGLGKTHLLHAIGNEVSKNFPKIKTLYVTCEKFTNEFIEAVQSGKTNKLKDIYRTVDVLIIDDIQFLAGKERTQEEFFHTFNELHQQNKQIILSSDRQPKAIPALEKRLVSRFEWGMIADISNPDLETRIAILEKKCEEKGLVLNKESVNYIVNNITNNIREIEGVLNRVIAYSQLRQVEPSLEEIRNMVSVVATKHQNSSLTPKQLIQIVAVYFDIAINDICGSSRKSELVLPRQIIMYLMREEIKISYPYIGQELGGRDHTTAMHAYTKIFKEIEKNDKLKNDIESIRQRIYNNQQL
jgi:chromosomal replication initiator protein